MYHILDAQIECRPVENLDRSGWARESMWARWMQVKSKITMPWIQFVPVWSAERSGQLVPRAMEHGGGITCGFAAKITRVRQRRGY